MSRPMPALIAVAAKNTNSSSAYMSVMRRLS
jgi:hypothetical protein